MQHQLNFMQRIPLIFLMLIWSCRLYSTELPKEKLDEIQQLIYASRYAEAQSQIYEQFKNGQPDKNEQVWLNILLSDIKRILNTKEESMVFARKALQISLSDEKGTRNRALVLHKIANIFYEEKAYDSAYYYAKKSISSAEKHMNRNNVLALRTMNLSIIGYYYLEHNLFGLAENAFLETNKLHEESGGHCETPLQFLKLADLELKRKNLARAEQHAIKAKQIADGCHINTYTFSAIRKLSDIYRLQNNADKLYSLTQERDSLTALENTNRQRENTAALEVKYKAEIKEQENQMLRIANQLQKGRNIRITIVLLLAVILLVASIFIVIQLRRKNGLIAQQNLEVQRLNALNRKIFSVISHDFKGPLQNLQATVEMTENEVLDTASFSMIANGIKHQIGQAQHILENLLSWAKSELNDDENTLTDAAFPAQVAAEISQQLRASLVAKSIEIKQEIPPELQVRLPADALMIIYRNLLSNAIKYSNDHGTIVLGYHKALDEEYFFVKDNGNGFSEDLLRKLFLNRVNSAQGTRAETGYGIGLHIVDELIRKNGGSISARNNPEGGAMICFQLPG